MEESDFYIRVIGDNKLLFQHSDGSYLYITGKVTKKKLSKLMKLNKITKKDNQLGLWKIN